jgi:hypothetical protein
MGIDELTFHDTAGLPTTPTPVQGGKIYAADGAGNTTVIDPNAGYWSFMEDAIQEAIRGTDTSSTSQTSWDGADQSGGGRVVLPQQALGFDESQITFVSSVNLIRGNAKEVLEVDDITDLRSVDGSIGDSVHVRTPTGQSGVFVPMDADPFARGDDGATALQSQGGTWWARKDRVERKTVSATEFGLFERPNRAAIQDAIDFTESRGGGEVTIPSRDGAWGVDGRIELPPKCTLSGQGRRNTRLLFLHSGAGIRPRDENGNVTTSERTGVTGGSVVKHCAIRNLRLNGFGNAEDGMRLIGIQHWYVENVECRGFTRDGFRLEGADFFGGGIFTNTFMHCRGQQNGARGFYGFRIGRSVNANYFYGLDAVRNGAEGFRLEAASGNVVDVTCEQNNQDDTNGNDYEAQIGPNCRGVRIQGFFENSESIHAKRAILITNSSKCYVGEATRLGILAGSENGQASVLIDDDCATCADRSRERTQTVQTESDGTVTVSFPVNLDPYDYMVYEENGRPVEVNSELTDGDGNFTSTDFRVLDFDGTALNAQTTVTVQTTYGK